MANPPARTRVLQGFDDPTFGPEQWEDLLRKRNIDIVYLTWQFQRAWWEAFREGELLLITAERNREVVALAPLYTTSGMVYFVGTGFEYDYLDFIGDISDPEILDALLETARACVPGFLGFRFHFVSGQSQTGKRLEEAAARLNLSCYMEGEDDAPVLDIAGRPEMALAAVNEKRLAKRERFFRRAGSFEVRHLSDGEAILPYLEEFFEQHISRWAPFGSSNPSRFHNPKVRLLFEGLTRIAAHTGLLRFTRIEWERRPIAFHYGFFYRSRYFWGVPSFAIDLARHSPGEVLLRQLLSAAIEQGARTFDFGTGNQAFKLRFATHVTPVRVWGLYA